MPPELRFLLPEPPRAAVSPVVGAVESREGPPPRMRPKRYLPQESKSDPSRSFNPQHGFGHNFFVSWAISSWNLVQIEPQEDHRHEATSLCRYLSVAVWRVKYRRRHLTSRPGGRGNSVGSYESPPGRPNSHGYL